MNTCTITRISLHTQVFRWRGTFKTTTVVQSFTLISSTPFTSADEHCTTVLTSSYHVSLSLLCHCCYSSYHPTPARKYLLVSYVWKRKQTRTPRLTLARTQACTHVTSKPTNNKVILLFFYSRSYITYQTYLSCWHRSWRFCSLSNGCSPQDTETAFRRT